MLDEILEGSMDEEFVDGALVEMTEFEMSVGSLEVEEEVDEIAVLIVAAVVMVAPRRVVVACPSAAASVFMIVKLYVPQPASSEPVPQIVLLASPPIYCVSALTSPGWRLG